MPEGQCAEKERLMHAVQEKLMEVARFARLEVDIIASGDRDKILEYDQKIENLLGEKERTLGAYYQHVDDHGC